jgi:hypothetical protein
MDGLGATLRLADSRTQDGCAVLRLDPPKFSTDVEFVLNHSTAALLRKALGMWLRHSEEQPIFVADDELE